MSVNTIWITGAHTPLGRAISAFFRAAGLAVAESGPEFDDIDFATVKAFADRAGPFSSIIHCGMAFDPEAAERDPALVLCKDQVMPLIFLRIAWVQRARFIAIGTPYVFSGSLASRDYTEKYTAAPVCALGRLQLAAERAILAADPRAIILRTGWLYGAPSSPAAPTAEADLLIDAILRAGAKGGAGLVQVPDDEIVSPTYGESLARIVLDMTLPDLKPAYVTGDEDDCVPDLRPIPGGIYHYADWGRATLPEFADEVVRLALSRKLIDRPVEIAVQPPSAFPGRAARPLHQHLSAQKLMHAMVLYQHPWQACLDEYLSKKNWKSPVLTCLSGCTGV